MCLVAQLCPTLCHPMNHGDSPGKNTGLGCHALLQGIFPTQGSKPGLLHCRWILYHLSHQGSPRTLKWVAYPFSSRSSWPRNYSSISCIAGGFFTPWPIREVYRKTNMEASLIYCAFFLVECPCETGSMDKLDYLKWGHINGLTCPYTIAVLMG